MIKFLVRDSQGEIVRTGSCQPSDLGLQAGPGEVAEENTEGVRDDTHYFDGRSYRSKGQRPDDEHDWDIQSKRWKRSEARAKVKQRRQEKEQAQQELSRIAGELEEVSDPAVRSILGKIIRVL